MGRLKTHDEFIKELELINNNIIVCSQYQKAIIKIHCKCKICNYEWDVIPASLLSKKGCPRCSGNLKKTHSEFSKEFLRVNTKMTLIGEYINNHTPIKCRCKKCDNIYNIYPNRLLRNSSCQVCAGISQKSHEDFIKEMSYVNNNIVIIGEYINAKTKIKCKCKLDEYEWYATPNSLLSKKAGCPKCAGNIKSNIESFSYRVRALTSGEYEAVGEYVNSDTITEILHVKCGKKYYVKPYNFFSGYRCPYCNISKGEKRIEEYLNSSNIDFIPQMKYDNLLGVGKGQLSYDFYLPTYYNLLIEYQGQYHDGTAGYQTEEQFKIQQEHDKRKKQYALDNNIKLLEIWYWDFDNIEEILHKELNL